MRSLSHIIPIARKAKTTSKVRNESIHDEDFEAYLARASQNGPTFLFSFFINMFGCSLSCSQAEFPASQTRYCLLPNISEHFRKKENKKKKRREIRKATAEDVRERETRARERERERERERKRVRVKAPECLFPFR